MKNLILLLIFIIFQQSFAQKVIFNKVQETHQNQDKFLYKIDQNTPNTKYLGEIEIQGYTSNDQELYKEIYQKAKEIGANAFSYTPFPTIDGKPNKFNPWNYKLSLYYLPKEQFPVHENQIYLFAPSPKSTTIKINNQLITFPSRTFSKINLEIGQEYTITTRKLLGSTIKLGHSQNQPVKHIQIANAQIKKSNHPTEGGLQIKTGDLHFLDRSYADFLSVVYTEFNIQLTPHK